MRDRLPLFLGLSVGITWVCQAPFVLLQLGFPVPPALAPLPAALGAVAPALVALVLSARWSGGPGLRTLGGGPGTKLGFLVPALIVVPALHLAATALFVAAGGETRLLPYLPGAPEAIGIAVLSPPGEETGWRGFALPRLQARLAPLPAALLLGVIWWAWHPSLLLTPATQLPLGFATVVGLSVIFSWLWNRSGGSLLVAIAAHLSIHLDNFLGPATLPEGLTPRLLGTGAVVLGATVTALLDRKLGARPG